jgi:hypothetical protein
LQFGKTTLLAGGTDYQGEERQKEPITTFRILSNNGKKKKLSRETSSAGTENRSGGVTNCVGSSNSVVSNNDPRQVDVACAGSSNSLVSNNDPKQHQVACAGAFNSVSGKKKNDISLVHQYVVICPSNAKFKWGMYNSIPEIMSMGCTGIGILKGIDGGLA